MQTTFAKIVGGLCRKLFRFRLYHLFILTVFVADFALKYRFARNELRVYEDPHSETSSDLWIPCYLRIEMRGLHSSRIRCYYGGLGIYRLYRDTVVLR